MPKKDETLSIWAGKLQALAEDGMRALQSGDADAVVRVQKALRRFPEQSPAAADSLDRTALRAAIDLDLRNSEASIERLQARVDEIQRLTKLISAVAEEASADAQALRLARIGAALSAANDTIGAFKELGGSLRKSGTDKEIADGLEELLKSLQKLRDQLELT